MLRLDLPVVAIVAVLLFILSLGGSLTRPAGVLLLLVGVAYTWLILRYTRTSRRRERAHVEDTADTADAGDATGAEGAMGTEDAAGPTTMTPPRAQSRAWPRLLLDLGCLAGGIALVILGADWLVTGAVDIDTELGVSDTLIGLTVVAIGTSAPELVTSVVATLRGQASMAIGNLIGSSV